MTPQEALDKLNVFINHPSTGDDNEADAIEAIGVLQTVVSAITEPKAEMKTWRVAYVRIPTNYHDTQCATVKARTAEDARTIVVRMLNNDVGMPNYQIGQPTELPPAPEGGVVGVTA